MKRLVTIMACVAALSVTSAVSAQEPPKDPEVGISQLALTTIPAKGGAKLTVTSLPGRHALGPLGRLLPPVMGTMLEYREAAGVLPFRVYLSGDTLVHPELRRIRERFDGIDLAVLHLGGTKVLGVLLTMDGRQGVDLMELLGPRTTVPVHYEEYGVMKSPLADFTAEISRRVAGLEVRVVGRGETLAL